VAEAGQDRRPVRLAEEGVGGAGRVTELSFGDGLVGARARGFTA
jgi:hypothetical protein